MSRNLPTCKLNEQQKSDLLTAIKKSIFIFYKPDSQSAINQKNFLAEINETTNFQKLSSNVVISKNSQETACQLIRISDAAITKTLYLIQDMIKEECAKSIFLDFDQINKLKNLKAVHFVNGNPNEPEKCLILVKQSISDYLKLLNSEQQLALLAQHFNYLNFLLKVSNEKPLSLQIWDNIFLKMSQLLISKEEEQQNIAFEQLSKNFENVHYLFEQKLSDFKAKIQEFKAITMKEEILEVIDYLNEIREIIIKKGDNFEQIIDLMMKKLGDDKVSQKILTILKFIDLIEEIGRPNNKKEIFRNFSAQIIVKLFDFIKMNVDILKPEDDKPIFYYKKCISYYELFYNYHESCLYFQCLANFNLGKLFQLEKNDEAVKFFQLSLEILNKTGKNSKSSPEYPHYCQVNEMIGAFFFEKKEFFQAANYFMASNSSEKITMLF